MAKASRKLSRLLITWILAAVLVGGWSSGSRVWAGEPDSSPNMPGGTTQLSFWAMLHGILEAGVLMPPPLP